MTTILDTIEAKSAQLTADDLAGGRTITIKITKPSKDIASEQPVAIHYEGGNGKPFMPCKLMRRVLSHVWGPDMNTYVGRRMTLYCDPEVRFGALKVGGVRISHMSDIREPVTMALQVTKGNKRAFTVHPLKDTPAAAPTPERAPTPADDTIDTPTLTGPVSDWADAMDAQLDQLSGPDVAPVFNPATKTDEWRQLREGDPSRAEALKQKAKDRAAVK